MLISCQHEYETFVVSNTYMASTISYSATVSYQTTKKAKRNNIVVLRIPGDTGRSCLRIIGWPGDKIEIVNGNIYINNVIYTLPRSANSVYGVYRRDSDFSRLSDFNFKPYAGKYGMISANQNEVDEIKEKGLVDSMYRLQDKSADVDKLIIRTQTATHFNSYYFGPIYIPKIGDTLYQEDHMLVRGYADFKKPYIVVAAACYFCIGDSADAMDSRIFGLVPESEILGVVTNIKNVRVMNIDESK